MNDAAPTIAQPTDTVERFPSAAALRAAHSALLKRERAEAGTPAFLDEVRDLIRRGRATGAILDHDAERRAGQSMLDYWAVVLYRADEEQIDSTLAEFDPMLAPLLPDDPCPYVGLEAFREINRDRFFGRRRLIDELTARLVGTRLLAVVGPSGSGKSSLVLGGLIPALKHGALADSATWRYFPPMVPGSEPLSNLARLIRPPEAKLVAWEQRLVSGMLQDKMYLARLIGALSRVPVVLVVDQFEEIFTLCSDTCVRQAFIDNLLSLTSASGPRHTVLLTMRSDFESFVARLPHLQPRFEQGLVRVTPMSAGELREAIVEPACQVGLKFEPQIVDSLINDILGEPAALPLLQFTLLKLWESRARNRVTWDAYKRLGGGRIALARSADAFYNALSPEQQRTMRRILLRMVRPADGLEFTSSRVRRAQLFQGGEAAYRIEEVLDKLVRARLVRLTEADTAADAQVEVAHEALVRNWPTLVDWLEEEREALRERRRLTAAAEQWKALGEDPGALLRGSVLNDALRLPADGLTKSERDLLSASVLARAKAEQAQDAARRRELAQAHALAEAERARADAERQRADEQIRRAAAEHRQTEERARADAERRRAEEQTRARRFLRVLAIALAFALVAALVATFMAYNSAAEATTQQRTAIAAQSEAQTQIHVRGTAEMRSRAAQQTAEAGANTLATNVVTLRTAESRALAAQRASKADAASLATSVAIQETSVAQAQAAQQTAQAEVVVRSAAEAQARTAEAQAFAALAAQQQAFAAQQTAEAQSARIASERDRAEAGAFVLLSQDERSAQQRVQLAIEAVKRDPAQIGALRQALQEYIPTPVKQGSSITSVAWSRDGARFATAGDDSVVRLWDARNGRQLGTFSGHTDLVTSLAWSPDGASVLSAGTDGNAMIWNAETLQMSATFDQHRGSVRSAAWSPGGQRVVTTGADRTIRIWNVTNQKQERVIEAGSHSISWAAWSPDSLRFVTVSGNSAYVWDANTGQQQLELIGHTGVVRTAAWSPDGQRIVTASADGTGRVWNAVTGAFQFPLQGHTRGVNSAFWTPISHRIITAGADGTVRIWDAGSGRELEFLQLSNMSIEIAIWNPDGRRIIVGVSDGTARVKYAEELQQAAESLVPTLNPTESAQFLANSLATPTLLPTATHTSTRTAVGR